MGWFSYLLHRKVRCVYIYMDLTHMHDKEYYFMSHEKNICLKGKTTFYVY